MDSTSNVITKSVSLAGYGAEETSALVRNTVGDAKNHAKQVIVFDSDRNHELIIMGMGGAVLGLSQGQALELKIALPEFDNPISQRVEHVPQLPSLIDVNLVDWFMLSGTPGFEKAVNDLNSFLTRLAPAAGTVVIFEMIEEVDQYLPLANMLSDTIGKWIKSGVAVAMAGKAEDGPLGHLSVELGTQKTYHW